LASDNNTISTYKILRKWSVNIFLYYL
jgi:hypothetical protein